MQADPFQIGTVLSEARRLVVPIYQRTYQWTEERQLGKLFDAIVDKANRRLLGEEGTFPHYMGALLLSPRGNHAFAKLEVFDVVDGQQRLITFQILIAAVRDLARSAGDDQLVSLLTPYLLNTDRNLMSDPEVERFKLQTTKYDRQLFQDLIDLDRDTLRSNDPESFFKNGNIRKSAPLPLMAWWFFREEAHEFAQEEDGEDGYEYGRRLRELSAALLENFRLIVITLGPEDDAQVIFETLNSGGEPLAAMDLVRNDVFHRAIRQGEDPERLMDQRWSEFENSFWKNEATQGRIKKPRIDFFLAHTLAAETGKETGLSELFSRYKAFARARGFATVEEELDTLLLHSPTYRSLVVPPSKGSLANLAKQLLVFDVSTAYPLVFIIAASERDDDEKAALYKLISSYIVRRALCGLTAKAYNITFVRIAGALRKSGVSNGSLKAAFAELDGPTVKFPLDNELTDAIATRVQYSAMPTPRLNYVIGELEKVSRDKFDESDGLRGDLTIEHILPDKWASHWPLPDGSFAPDDYIVSGDDPRRDPIDRREIVKHTLGNLTLLTPSGNPRLGNLPFAVTDKAVGRSKREALRGSLLKMNQEIAACDDWGEKQISERAKILAERAALLWPNLS
jgi:hypothetical protein